MLFSTCLFPCLNFFVIPPGEMAGTTQLVRSLLLVQASLAAMASFWVPRIVQRMHERDFLRRGQAEVTPEALENRIRNAIQTPFVLRMALIQSLAVDGTVLWVLGEPAHWVYLLFAIAFVLQLIIFPTQEWWDEQLRLFQSRTP